MALTVNIPQTEGRKSVRNAIIDILSVERSLTAKKIYNRVRINGHHVSYQAVHKTLKEMTEAGVLIRQGKEYTISLSWVETINQFANKMKSVYSQTITAMEVLFKDHSNLTFNTVMEMYRYFLEFLSSERCRQVMGEDISLGYLNHMWFSFIGTEDEQQQFREFMKKATGILFIRGNTSIDNLLAAYYTEVGKDVKVYFGVETKLDFDRIVIGNFIIDVYIPEDIEKVFDLTYSSANVLSDARLSSLYETILYKQAEINVMISLNSKLAAKLRRQAIEKSGQLSRKNQKLLEISASSS
ncbi:MAG: hypothetical protein HYX24_03175 [Candidatus Aenigmarchaeota archaeon]|nr:hypothetical protein [Candidatus Aenigmarchaeota archaeon]